MEFGKVCYCGQDDDLIQRQLLPCSPIYAKQAGKMGSKGVVLGGLKFNFEIYCSKNANGPKSQVPACVGEGSMACNVVLGLMEGLKGKGHVIVIDNFFPISGYLQSWLTVRFMQWVLCIPIVWACQVISRFCIVGNEAL